MRIVFPLFLLWIGWAAPLVASSVDPESCQRQVVYNETVAASLREEIVLASQNYQVTHEGPAFASNLDPHSVPELFHPREAFSTIETHVISLGSGPDISRVLFNFPFASHIHLVDVMEGWFFGGAIAFSELEGRLKHLAPGVRVTLEEPGFLSQLTPAEIDCCGPTRFLIGDPNSPYAHPTRWRLEWESPSAGKQVKWVWLHLKDYHSPLNAREILSNIPPTQLGAVFVTGARLPRQTFWGFLSSIRPGGLFVADLDFMDVMGESSTRLEDVISRRILSQAGLWEEHVFPRNHEMLFAFPDNYWPKLHFFRKPE